MARFSTRSSFYLASAMSVLACSPAFAQAPADQSPPASADQEVTSSDEIIVTARRSEERLQDVPISITVFSQQQLTNLNIVTPTDLGTYTPSLAVNQRFGPEKATFSIRGFVQENATAPSVGVYFADVVPPRAQGGTASGNSVGVGAFMDLQNVQVLKGPQGTLFGRNTTGGAILLVPRKPTDRFEGNVEFSAGDYNMMRIQGVVNLPVSDNLRIRFAADRNVRDGYMKNHSGIGPDAYNDVDYVAARLSVVADLTPELENYTIASYSHSFAHGYGSRIVICDPSISRTFLTPASVARITGPSACDQLARQNARGDGLLDVDINNPDSKIDLRQWQLINTTTWQVSNNLRIKNIFSYAQFRETDAFSLNGDNFFIPLDVVSPLPLVPGARYAYIQPHGQSGDDGTAQSTFTEELQFQGTFADGRLNWQAGGYLEISNPLGWSLLGYSANLLHCTDTPNLVCTNPILIGSVSDSARKIYFRNKGLYAQATYNITKQLSITGGIRYTMDKIRSIAMDTRLRPAAGGTFTRTCNDTVRFGGAPVASREQCRIVLREASKKPTWLIGVDYKPTDDILLYAKYARGYRQGGINPTNVGLETWGPEKVDAYEIGAKASFRGAVRGYFNIAAFYNDFSDQQINVNGISNVAGFAGSQPVVNAGKSTIKGIEVDATATFFDSLQVDLGYTYLSTELKSITVPAIPPGAPYSALIPTAVVGGPLALSPKHRLTATATYTLPLPESIGEIKIGATYVHTSEQAFTQATLPQFRNLPATDLFNINVNWDNFMGQPFDLAFFMTNVTNEIYPVAVGSSYNSAGFENLLFGAPRMWGFRARYRFGE